MKKCIYTAGLLIAMAATFSSCGPKCAKCHAEVMGVKSPEQEYCDEQLEQARKTPNMVCDK